MAIAWTSYRVVSPGLPNGVEVVAALNVPYIQGHRFQTLNIYTPLSPTTKDLVGTSATTLPTKIDTVPRVHVHVHGGAWRDPSLTATSIEAAVAHAFDSPAEIDVVVSINYTLSPFPTHPTHPYDPVKDNHADPSREAQHPKHVSDVLHALSFLRQQYGLQDGSYILTGHSAGACLVMQATLMSPAYWQQADLIRPTPAAVAGLNGLYDLVELVEGLGSKHKGLRDVYDNLIGIAFGKDKMRWNAASPARFDIDIMSSRTQSGQIPPLVLLDQSVEDQLVPVNQRDRLRLQLSLVDGLEVVQGHRCTGAHAAPWEEGYMIWETVQDVLKLLQQRA